MHFSYAGRNDVPTAAWFSAPPSAPKVGNNLLIRITPQTQAFLLPIVEPTDADIFVVPFSFFSTKTQKEFGVQAEKISPQPFDLDRQIPIGHFYARQLLWSDKTSGSPTPNAAWERTLESLRLETNRFRADRPLSKASKIITFQKPIDGKMPIMGSALIYSKEQRKVLCFVAQDWPEAFVEAQIGACLAVLYGYVGPELDYDTEVTVANIIKYQSLEECSRAMQIEAEKAKIVGAH